MKFIVVSLKDLLGPGTVSGWDFGAGFGEDFGGGFRRLFRRIVGQISGRVPSGQFGAGSRNTSGVVVGGLT